MFLHIRLIRAPINFTYLLTYIRKWVRFENTCPKFGVSLLLIIKPDAPKRPFSTTAQLDLRNETWHIQSSKCVGNYKGSLKLTSSQNVMNFGHKRLKIEPEFLPTLRNFCIVGLYCIARQASHAEWANVSKRNSTKLCQTVAKVDVCSTSDAWVVLLGEMCFKNWTTNFTNQEVVMSEWIFMLVES